MNLIFESAVFELNTQFIMVIVIIVVGVIGYVIKQSNNLENSRKMVFGLFVLFVLYELYAHYAKTEESKKIQQILATNQYQSVEGEIQELNIVKALGYFKINNTPFEVDYKGSELPEKSFFFALSKHEKAPILQNGQRVKVDYVVVDGKNRILRLWVGE
ncbi:MAG TPA: hypothetical protein ENK95_03955 [Campylobacterales bacterium]|nr:hypothetical protein [Campylobacterales bacterium]